MLMFAQTRITDTGRQKGQKCTAQDAEEAAEEQDGEELGLAPDEGRKREDQEGNEQSPKHVFADPVKALAQLLQADVGSLAGSESVL